MKGIIIVLAICIFALDIYSLFNPSFLDEKKTLLMYVNALTAGVTLLYFYATSKK